MCGVYDTVSVCKSVSCVMCVYIYLGHNSLSYTNSGMEITTHLPYVVISYITICYVRNMYVFGGGLCTSCSGGCMGLCLYACMCQ